MPSLSDRLLPNTMETDAEILLSGDTQRLMDGATGVRKKGPRHIAGFAEYGMGALSGTCPGYPYIRDELARRGRDMSDDERNELLRGANIVAIQNDLRETQQRLSGTPFAHRKPIVNTMIAADDCQEMIRTVSDSGLASGKIFGAGLNTKVPRTMSDYPDMMFGVIVSTGRAMELWMKAAVGKKEMQRREGMEREELKDAIAEWNADPNNPRQPDFVYIERPNAGGHDGAKDQADCQDPYKLDFHRVHQDVDSHNPDIPVFYGGGISNHNALRDSLETFEAVYAEKENWAKQMIRPKGATLGTYTLVNQLSEVPDEVLLSVYLNKAFPVVQRDCSPAGLPSTFVDNGFFEIANQYREAMEICVSCIGRGRCGFRKNKPEKPSYCIAEWLTRNDGVNFAGLCLEDMRGSPPFERDGKPYVPTMYENMYTLLKGHAPWPTYAGVDQGRGVEGAKKAGTSLAS